MHSALDVIRSANIRNYLFLQSYYDSVHCCFEVSADEVNQVESFLDEYFYDVNCVAPNVIEPFCVLKVLLSRPTTPTSSAWSLSAVDGKSVVSRRSI
jgi:hypothetical protein